MITDKDLQRQAYIDNQLSVDEAIRFEGELTPQEKRQLQAEVGFENALAGRLSVGADCPDALWRELQQRLEQQPTAGHSSHGIRRSRTALPRVAAAIVVSGICAALAVHWFSIRRHHPVALVLSSDRNAIAACCEVPGDYEKVRSCLTNNGIFINLHEPDPAARHPIELLGMRVIDRHGSKLAQLFFSCCGQPVEAFIETKKGGESILSRIQDAGLNRWFTGHRDVDKYRIMVISPHIPDQVLDLFS